MTLFYTNQSLISLQESQGFLFNELNLPLEKIREITKEVLDCADKLVLSPLSFQKELYLTQLELGHRRKVCGNFKVIYLIKRNTIYVTDIFDTRQGPTKMKG